MWPKIQDTETQLTMAWMNLDVNFKEQIAKPGKLYTTKREFIATLEEKKETRDVKYQPRQAPSVAPKPGPVAIRSDTTFPSHKPSRILDGERTELWSRPAQRRQPARR